MEFPLPLSKQIICSNIIKNCTLLVNKINEKLTGVSLCLQIPLFKVIVTNG